MLLPCLSLVHLHDQENLLFINPNGTTAPGRRLPPKADFGFDRDFIWDEILRGETGGGLGPIDEQGDDLDITFKQWQMPPFHLKRPGKSINMLQRIVCQLGRMFTRAMDIIKKMGEKMKAFER